MKDQRKKDDEEIGDLAEAHFSNLARSGRGQTNFRGNLGPERLLNQRQSRYKNAEQLNKRVP